ncbi:MAG: flagellar hook-length control protein FliK [Chloroflexi bacterium]|nr:flagellar hook-length control protein FliK [Chloroflexota bacterium]
MPVEPVAPVARVAPARFLSAEQGGLAAGQVVRARVARVDGDIVQLRLGGQTMRVASRVPLAAGQQVTLRVEEGTAGTLLLRMVDDTFGKGYASRADGSADGRGGVAQGAMTGRGVPIVSRSPGRPDGGSHGGADGRPSGEPNQGSNRGPGAHAGGWSFAGGAAGRSAGSMAAGELVTLVSADLAGEVVAGDGADVPATRIVPEGDVSEQAGTKTSAGATMGARSGAGALAGSADGPSTPGPATRTGDDGTADLVARTAMPAYGRLAQSLGVSGDVARMLAALGRAAIPAGGGAAVLPADLGRLLVDVGVHPDEVNARLVGEMIGQGVPVTELAVRSLRRDLAAAGGMDSDIASAVLLRRLGLPLTPLTLAIGRQTLAGQLDPRRAWSDGLAVLQRLARSGDPASATARALLVSWQVPVEGDAAGIVGWLQRTLGEVATPTEARLVGGGLGAPPADGSPPSGTSLDPAGRPTGRGQAAAAPEPSASTRGGLALSGDDPLAVVSTALSRAGDRPPGTRAQVDGLIRELAAGSFDTPTTVSQTLRRLQATVQAEQIVNAGHGDRTEPRFFIVTLPAMLGNRATTLEMSVRERDARQRDDGDAMPTDVVRLRLQLPNLGDLRIRLAVGTSNVSCHFTSSTPFSEALLDATSSELVGRLERLGFRSPLVDATHRPNPAPAGVPTPRVRRVDVTA